MKNHFFKFALLFTIITCSLSNLNLNLKNLSFKILNDQPNKVNGVLIVNFSTGNRSYSYVHFEACKYHLYKQLCPYFGYDNFYSQESVCLNLSDRILYSKFLITYDLNLNCCNL